MAEKRIEQLRLYGRIFLEMDIHTVTGLRIGGSPVALEIGGLDNVVIRDPITYRPYIPGSTLRGKMRSLWEKFNNALQNQPVGQAFIHGKPVVQGNTEPTATDYEKDAVLRIFGVTSDAKNVPNPTRLIVHDVFMDDQSIHQLETVAQTDQPYTETKWEAVIDRVTSAAVPRQMERVPAGTIFGTARLVYSVYGTSTGNLDDVEWFFHIIKMLELLEDDYIGSSGSRGSGRIKFDNLNIWVRNYRSQEDDLPIDLAEAQSANIAAMQAHLMRDLPNKEA